MVRYVLCLIFSLTVLSSYAETKRYPVYLELVADTIKVDGKRCYFVRSWGNFKTREMNKCEWNLFCGEFTHFYIEQGYAYPLWVEDYYPGIDTIRVRRPFSFEHDEVYGWFNKRVWSEYEKWKRKQKFIPTPP